MNDDLIALAAFIGANYCEARCRAELLEHEGFNFPFRLEEAQGTPKEEMVRWSHIGDLLAPVYLQQVSGRIEVEACNGTIAPSEELMRLLVAECTFGYFETEHQVRKAHMGGAPKERTESLKAEARRALTLLRLSAAMWEMHIYGNDLAARAQAESALRYAGPDDVEQTPQKDG